ncbi:MAG: hypothetical protein KF696_15360 [Planctomycetes bacterium]|nr:hypothetical protein [Planctomycetota bacterium]MCW8136050.1 hypothetical protein [Planctomycetota bacterium]
MSDKSDPFHDCTVVVESAKDQTFIGRYLGYDDKGNLMLGSLDHFHGGFEKNRERLEGALQWGAWVAIDKAFIPREDVRRIDLLNKAPWRT